MVVNEKPRKLGRRCRARYEVHIAVNDLARQYSESSDFMALYKSVFNI